MNDHDSSSVPADQRRTNRRSLEATVALRLETDTLTGTSDNISRAGLLFFSDEPLRVTVEVRERRRAAHLPRPPDPPSSA
jgi:hypothetical protein